MKTKVASCQQQYANWKSWCEKTRHMEIWEVAEPAIIVKGNFYKAEIVRAKHNIARHMLGRDPEPSMFAGVWLEEIDKALAKVGERIQNLAEDFYECKRTEGKGAIHECWVLHYELSTIIFGKFLNSFTELAEWGKRRTYGGSV